MFCAMCHTTSSWVGAVFNHNTFLFSLTGAHAVQSCAACHSDGVYAGKSTLCVSCHADNVFQGKGTTCVTCHRVAYDATSAPAHTTAGYSTDCVACHSTLTWLGATGPAVP